MVMSVKRVIINLMVIIAAFIIFVLWYENCIRDMTCEANSLQGKYMPAEPSENQTYKIYLITNEAKYQFWQYMNQGVSDMAQLLGLTFTWEAPEIQDAQQQIELLNKAVNNGADAILISVLDADKLSEPIRNAKSKGVKIIYVNSAANEEGIVTLATNNYEAGRIAAESMLDELEVANIHNGVIGIISVMEGNPTITKRDSGFIDVIKADNRFTVLEPVYTGGNPELAEKAATALIREQPNLVALFGSNEGASVGVGNAIKADNNRIIGIAFDTSDAIMQLMRQNSIKEIIAQNPYTMGYLGMAEAYAALKGKSTGPANIDTGVSVISRR